MQLKARLVKMTCEEGVTIYKACRRLRINYSTAKTIIRNHKKNDGLSYKKQPANVFMGESPA